MYQLRKNKIDKQILKSLFGKNDHQIINKRASVNTVDTGQDFFLLTWGHYYVIVNGPLDQSSACFLPVTWLKCNLVVAKNMESLLDFSVSPLIFVIRGAYYSSLNVFLGGERVMSLVDILVTFVFGVCLPTLDTYSDLGLAYTLIRPTCRKYKGYIYHEKYIGWSSKFLHQGKSISFNIFK